MDVRLGEDPEAEPGHVGRVVFPIKTLQHHGVLPQELKEDAGERMALPQCQSIHRASHQFIKNLTHAHLEDVLGIFDFTSKELLHHPSI